MKRFRPRRRPRCTACQRRGHNRRNRLCPKAQTFEQDAATPMPGDAGKPIDGAVPLTPAEAAALRIDIRTIEAALARRQRTA